MVSFSWSFSWWVARSISDALPYGTLVLLRKMFVGSGTLRKLLVVGGALDLRVRQECFGCGYGRLLASLILSKISP